MRESKKNKSNQKCFNTITKLLDYEYSYESKESTCEEMYDQIIKHKTNLRRENHQLQRQIQQTKQAILTKALGIYFNELRELNQNNQSLREKHRIIYQTKKPILKGVQQLPYEPLHTPRSRRSIVNIYNNDNSQVFSRTSLNLNLPRQSDLLAKRKSFKNQNIQNVRPLRTFGRNSLKISQAPRKNYEQQLTQRKMMNSGHLGSSRQNNVSTFSETHSICQSIKGRSRTIQAKDSENIFLNFIQVMLEEEKEKEKEVFEINSEQMFFHRNHEQIYTDSLEKEIEKSSKNLQKIQKILQRYESEIRQMQMNITSVTEMTKQIGKMKNKYIVIRQKCKNIQSLRIQVTTKQRRLKQLKQNSKLEAFEPPSSIQMMLRLFGIEQNSINNPLKCKEELKNLVKGNIEKPTKKKVKVKELLDTIREGRKKFKQLMSVYEGRIKKLERKLISLKFQQKNVQQ